MNKNEICVVIPIYKEILNSFEIQSVEQCVKVLSDYTIHFVCPNDLNISFEYKKQGFKVMVTNEILLEHFSLGIINEAWVRSTHIIHQRYKNLLPLGKSKKPINKKVEVASAERFINESFKYNLIIIAISVWVQLFCLNTISKYHFRFWKRIINEKLC